MMTSKGYCKVMIGVLVQVSSKSVPARPNIVGHVHAHDMR